MSTRVHNEPIPFGKLMDFDEILKACGGRYLSNPVVSPDQYGHYRVSYEYDDADAHNEHQRRWRQVTQDMREVRKDQWWRKAMRRLKLGWICR
jgi:hypothetical protein